MKSTISGSKIIKYAAFALLVLGAVTSVYAPSFALFKWWSRYAPQITLGYWMLGLIFLLFKRQDFTLVCFVCSAFLSLYLKTTTNSSVYLPTKNAEPVVTIGQFNLSASKSNYLATLNSIKSTKADIISLQEVTPEWQPLIDSLRHDYPYRCSTVGFDLYSIMLLSKHPFSKCDTIYINHVPTLSMTFSNRYIGGKFHVLSTYVAPPLFESAYRDLKKQLDTLGNRILDINEPTFSIGDFNIHATSLEIQQLKYRANLKGSRRGFRPDRHDGHISMFDVPTDYILYTPHFNCVEFKTINGPSAEHLGIMGVYQFDPDSLLSTNSKDIKQARK